MFNTARRARRWDTRTTHSARFEVEMRKRVLARSVHDSEWRRRHRNVGLMATLRAKQRLIHIHMHSFNSTYIHAYTQLCMILSHSFADVCTHSTYAHSNTAMFAYVCRFVCSMHVCTIANRPSSTFIFPLYCQCMRQCALCSLSQHQRRLSVQSALSLALVANTRTHSHSQRKFVRAMYIQEIRVWFFVKRACVWLCIYSFCC